jgi:hypothetical protein
MLESVPGFLKAGAEVVHYGNVIGQFLGWGQLGKPAAFSAFWEVNPAAFCERHLVVQRSRNAQSRKREALARGLKRGRGGKDTSH